MSVDEGSGSGSNPWTQWMSGFAQLGQGPAGKVYKEWESWFSQHFDRLARNESFLAQISKALEGSFVMKSQMDRWVDASIKSMRLPSARDVEAVHERLNDIERRMASLGDRFEMMARAVEVALEAADAPDAPAEAEAPDAPEAEIDTAPSEAVQKKSKSKTSKKATDKPATAGD